NPNIELTAAAFPDQFKAVIRLEKIGVLINRLRLSSGQLDWLVTYASGVPPRSVPWSPTAPLQVRWLALDELPAEDGPRVPARFGAWLRLLDLRRVRDSVPGGEVTLTALFQLAR